MTHILHIDASAHGETSTSRAASAKIVADLLVTHAGATVAHRDLAASPLPQIDAAWADARLTDPDSRSTDDATRLALSDSLVAELQAADIIVIGVPIYNFAGPASLKAWMDLVARPRVTFRYNSDGPEGLLTGKSAVVAVASGGVAVESEMDFLSPHLRQFLAFIGITDIDIRAAKEVVPQAA